MAGEMSGGEVQGEYLTAAAGVIDGRYAADDRGWASSRENHERNR